MVFEGWMRVLLKIPRGVLWLYEENPWSAKNLVEKASEFGVSGERLIFAKKVSREEYITQYRHADLFLDNFPYNAGTTASDALWAGLPILTCAGDSFASRMAASLLKTIGLPDLITTTQEEYERKAIELAQNPGGLSEIRRRLGIGRVSSPLFNGKLFARHIESAYQAMYERYQADLPPDHIYISS